MATGPVQIAAAQERAGLPGVTDLLLTLYKSAEPAILVAKAPFIPESPLMNRLHAPCMTHSSHMPTAACNHEPTHAAAQLYAGCCAGLCLIIIRGSCDGRCRAAR